MLLSSLILNAELFEEIIAPEAANACEIRQQLLDEPQSLYNEEGLVIVNCSYHSMISSYIRIWDTTVLIDRSSGHRSRLLQAINIPLAPVWMTVKEGTTRFTLVFSGLPENCETFDLYEDIQLWGKFEVRGIRRNTDDIYEVTI